MAGSVYRVQSRADYENSSSCAGRRSSVSDLLRGKVQASAVGRRAGKTKGRWIDELYFNESMSVYHLLHYTKDVPAISGKWVPSHTIDGVVSRNPAVKDPLLSPFEEKYAGRTEDFKKSCRAAGGIEIKAGDAAYEFEVFPQVHMQLILWDQDEDFPAQVQVLVDQCVTDFVHYETVGCMIADLLERLQGE